MSSNPAWWKDARVLEYLFAGAWAQVSSGFFNELKAAFKDKDVARAEATLKTVNNLGPMMVDAVGKKTSAILTMVGGKARKSWRREIKQLGVEKAADDKFQQYIARKIDRQISAFLGAHPDRVLTPQIEQEIENLKQSDLTTTSDVSDLLERLERIEPQTQYWQNLSTVQISRQWHSDGILRAQDDGIKRVVVTGPIDSFTCPVCRRFVGLEYNIEDLATKVDASLNLTDIYEYIHEFPFPRLKDVDNLSRTELASRLFFLPFHTHCRHSFALLSR